MSNPKACYRSTWWGRWLVFNAVGAMGYLVQLAAIALFKELGGMNYLPATAAAVEVAVLHNFFWHERWTWADRGHGSSSEVLARLVRFEMTNGVFSIIGNLILMRVYAGMWGLNYIIANTLAIASCSIVNFMAGDRLVYRQAGEPARMSQRVF